MAFSHYIVSTIAHFCTLLALNFELWVNFGWAHPDLVSELCITVYVKVTTNTYCCCWHSCVHHCYHHIVSSHHTADMLEYTFHYWHIGTHYFHTLYTVHTYNVGYNKHCIQRGRYWEAGVIDRTKLVPPKKIAHKNGKIVLNFCCTKCAVNWGKLCRNCTNVFRYKYDHDE